jgi:hypothetical protein
MQISMAQSMGLQPPSHLYHHHVVPAPSHHHHHLHNGGVVSVAAAAAPSTPVSSVNGGPLTAAAVLFTSSASSAGPTSTGSLPAMSTDVSEFFSQLEHPDEDDSVGVALSNFLQQADSGGGKSLGVGAGRFHPYESATSSSRHSSSTAAYSSSSNNDDVLMEAAASPIGGGYQTAYGGQSQFVGDSVNSGGLLYQNSGGSDGYGGFSGGDVPDQSGEDIWDLDSHTVRRYNPPPLPDPVSPGPIPTTPTMYGLQGSKAGWEPAPAYPPQYTTLLSGGVNHSRAGGGQVSPGIGGPWIGGGTTAALPLKAPSLIGSSGAGDVSKRPKSYQCEACDKWFTSSGHLKRHFNTTLHKNAMKQKGGGGDGYLEGGLGGGGGSYSIPSVESRGPASPCLSLGGEEESSQSCDEASSQSSQVSLTPAGTPGPLQRPPPPPPSAISPPLSASSPFVPNLSPSHHQQSNSNNNNHQQQHHLLSPPPSSVGLSDAASSPLSGLSQLVGQPPSTPQPPTAMSPLTPGMSPNGNLAGSPARNRYSPFRSGGGPLTTSVSSASHSYKVQSLDMRGGGYTAGYSTGSTFQQASSPAFSSGGDVYSLAVASPQSSYRSDGYGGVTTTYTGQYQAQYQPLVYNGSSGSYAMVGSSSSHHLPHHQSYLGMSTEAFS